MLERTKKAQKLIAESCEAIGRPVSIMEVCGTHTVAIFRHGIKSSLPANLRLLSGPGCPVCVTDQGYIDAVLELADREDCIIATYGDMVRVPGRGGSLETRPARGRVKVVLSSCDALRLARENPDKNVVFVAVGFETTAPATAVAVKEAQAESVENFYVLSGHKLVTPAMRALLSAKNNKIDAFLCPGHVAVIIGWKAFAPIVEEFGRPCVVAGFEAVQIVEAIAELCRQLAQGKAELKSVYTAVVSEGGNAAAQQVMAECFEVADGYWRGLGKIAGSTLRLKEQYARHDAWRRFGITERPGREDGLCRCGEVLCGLIDPPECSLFGRSCTVEAPVGACMVSSEGTCAAWFKYGRIESRRR